MTSSKNSSKNNNSDVFAAHFFDFARNAGSSCRLRFAPTPSGYLHRGNALNFILNWLVARLNGGHILLRIDDLDADRKRPEYVADIFERLEWLGLDWNEGPGLTPGLNAVADFESNWSQHQRVPLYFNLLERLRDENLLFACRKSRSELAPFQGRYPQEFRNQGLQLDDPEVAWRIRTATDIDMADFVVRRRDGVPAYQIASVADDIHFGITHVIRGQDLAPSTSAQHFLGTRLQEDGFLKIQFLHHPLLLDEQGEKLSKSAGASSLKSIQEGGGSPDAIFMAVAALLGLQPVTSAPGLLDAARSALTASTPFSQTRV